MNLLQLSEMLRCLLVDSLKLLVKLVLKLLLFCC